MAAEDVDPLDFPAPLSSGLEVAHRRLLDSTQRLRYALALPVDDQNEVQVNASVADWLDAVYAARDPWLQHRRTVLFDLQDSHPDGGLLKGTIYARNAATHHRVQASEAYVGGANWDEIETGWGWSERLGNPEERDEELKEAYDKELAATFIEQTIDPVEHFLTHVLPGQVPLP